MVPTIPRVSIGMPVYNGESYLREALDSFLAQTFRDFELIISDNASTDATQRICLEYARKDQRIRYRRNPTNIGAARNFNLLFQLSLGEYFKWAAHDDICAPDYLSRCVDILDNHPSVVLCHPRTTVIHEAGSYLHDYPFTLNVSAHDVQTRFIDLLLIDHWCVEVFGLIRAQVLRKTRLIDSYAGSDKILLAQLALYGPFMQIPDILFFNRKRSPARVFPTYRARECWNDPAREGRMIFPYWCNLRAACSAILHAPLTWPQCFACFRIVAKWIALNRHGLVDDIETHSPLFRLFYAATKYLIKRFRTQASFPRESDSAGGT